MPSYADYYNGNSGGMQQRSPFSMLSPMARYIDARIKRRGMGSMLSSPNPYAPEGMDPAAMGQRIGYGNAGAYSGGTTGGAPAQAFTGRPATPGGQRFSIGLPGFPIPGTPWHPGYNAPQPRQYPMAGLGREIGDAMPYPRRQPIKIPRY